MVNWTKRKIDRPSIHMRRMLTRIFHFDKKKVGLLVGYGFTF